MFSSRRRSVTWTEKIVTATTCTVLCSNHEKSPAYGERILQEISIVALFYRAWNLGK